MLSTCDLLKINNTDIIVRVRGRGCGRVLSPMIAWVENPGPQLSVKFVYVYYQNPDFHDLKIL